MPLVETPRATARDMIPRSPTRRSRPSGARRRGRSRSRSRSTTAPRALERGARRRQVCCTADEEWSRARTRRRAGWAACAAPARLRAPAGAPSGSRSRSPRRCGGRHRAARLRQRASSSGASVRSTILVPRPAGGERRAALEPRPSGAGTATVGARSSAKRWSSVRPFRPPRVEQPLLAAAQPAGGAPAARPSAARRPLSESFSAQSSRLTWTSPSSPRGGVDSLELHGDPVEPIEQRVELPVWDVVAFHGADSRPPSRRARARRRSRAPRGVDRDVERSPARPGRASGGARR